MSENTIDYGGPAFPRPTVNYHGEETDTGRFISRGVPGMTLRDWFAGQTAAALAGRMLGDALQAAVEDDADEKAAAEAISRMPAQIANLSLALADALLAARKGGSR